MKKLLFLFLSLLVAGSIFQACDDSKTYAEQLDDEKDAVNLFIKDHGINVISLEEFERDTVTAPEGKGNEYVAFSNGVYMQIVKRGSKVEADTFVTNNVICVRYVEQNVQTRDTVGFNAFLPKYADVAQFYADPLVFRYVESGTSSYGTFLSFDYFWYQNYQSTEVPAGWLLAIPYIRNGAHVRLIIPSKMGHSLSQQYVTPYFYDLSEVIKAES